MKYIITGASGFIGSSLIQHLNTRGITSIIAVDKVRNSNMNGLIYDTFYEPSSKELYKCFSKNDVVIHLGACTDTMEENETIFQGDYEYCIFLISMARASGCRVIYASSAGVYGNEHYFSDSENINDLSKCQTTTLYALYKKEIDRWKIHNKVHCVGLRFFNVWGEKERFKGRMESLVSKRYDDIQNQKPITLYTHPTKKLSRDFIYVKDICRVIERFTQSDEYGIFNVGTGISTQWDELVSEYAKAAQKECFIEFIDMPKERENNYQFYSQSDNTKLLSLPIMKDFEFTGLHDALVDFIHERKKTIKE